MKQASDQARVAFLLSLTVENDRELGKRLGISQPTMWRLRHGKIARPGRYIPPLEAYLSGSVPSEVEDILAELRLLSGRSAKVVDILRDLLAFIQVHS